MTATIDPAIKEKIQKLLTLSSNNPSEDEAMSALIKARKLMAKHGFSDDDVSPDGKPLEIVKCESPVVLHQHYATTLASIIAKAYGVFSYCNTTKIKTGHSSNTTHKSVFLA